MAASNFVPTPQEQAMVASMLAIGDTKKLGVIQGDSAVQLLSGADLPPAVLGTIWQIADDENNGFLTRKGLGITLRLIGWAQRGENVTVDLLNKPGPVPTIRGIPAPTPSLPSSPPPRSPPPRGSGLPPLTADDRTKFTRMFIGAGPSQGILSGEKARDIFVRSKLPLEKLGQIWNLADTQSRGALDSTDFAIAMYLIQLCMSQPAFVLPSILPPGIYDQASGKIPPDGVRTHMTGGSNGIGSPGLSNSFPATITPQYTGQPLRQQYTGQQLQMHHTGQSLQSNPASRLSISTTGPPTSMTSSLVSSPSWDITPQEKATADNFFRGLDKTNVGYIEGDVAVPFMLNSRLPDNILAQIWDLADLNKDGKLTKDGFAVALHLINGKLVGKEVPETLPNSLVPPSHRMKDSAFQAATETQRDLWLLDDTPPASATQPQFQARPTSPTMTPAPSHVRFAPPTTTTTSVASNLDLLGDDEATAAAHPVPDHSVEIGNIQNRLGSTRKSLETTQTERQSMEKTLNESALALSQLESQLASAKAAYETETRLLSDLRERFATQSALIAKTREELIRAESDLSATKVEKSEVEGGVLRDKEEIRELQRKMKQVGEEAELLKKDVEKAKKDARHQKGLLAINKKQLASVEAERAKTEKEVEDAKAEAVEAERELAEVQAQLASITSASTTADMEKHTEEPVRSLSPASMNSTISKNPFDKFTSASRENSIHTPFTTFSPLTHAPDNQSIALHDDPFGFNTAFAATSPLASPPIASQIPSPSTEEPPATISQAILPPASPTPPFLTPQATANDPASVFPAIDNVAAQYPPLDDGTPTNHEDDMAPPKEIEEADSSDDDSDDYAAARIESIKGKEVATTGTSGDATPKRVSEEDTRSVSPGLRAHSPEATTSSTFDDAFGSGATSSVVEVSPPASQIPQQLSQQSPVTSPAVTPVPTTALGNESHLNQSSKATEPAVKPELTPFTSFTSSIPTAPAANNLDEAFGIAPAHVASNGNTPFQFNSNFDDAFDFATFTPAITVADDTKLAATTGTPNVESKPEGTSSDPFSMNSFAPTTISPAPPLSFDDAFNVPTTASQPKGLEASTQSLAFDDAFGTASSSNFDDAFGIQPAKVERTPTQHTPIASSPAPQLPAMNIPNTQTNDIPPEPLSPPTQTPLRAPDLPARSRSPAPGSITSISSPTRAPPSSRGTPPRVSVYEAPSGPPPPAEPPAKQSRFHFPGFGRSKTTKKSSRAKSPAADRSVSTASSTSLGMGGGSDDVEGVKQICAMGFTRDQAVAALEKYDYNVTRALNGLLEESQA